MLKKQKQNEWKTKNNRNICKEIKINLLVDDKQREEI